MYLLRDHENSSEYLSQTQTTLSTDAWHTYRIADGDPLSASTTSMREVALERPGWWVEVTCDATLSCDASDFIVDDTLVAMEGGEVLFERTRQMRFPRGLL